MSEEPQQTTSEWIVDGEQKVQVRAQLYDDGWLLDIVDEDGNRTFWEDPFPTDADALAEGRAAVAEAGVAFFIGQLDSF